MYLKKVRYYLAIVLCHALLFAMFPLFSQKAEAAGNVYYVDPVSGNDANSGTSTSSPWKTIPGTMKADDSDWYSPVWGSITSSNKLQAGDTIYVKAGTTIDYSNGGRLQIDSTFYNTSSSENITIMVSPSWGSGNVTLDGSGITVPNWTAIVNIRVGYISLKGAGSSARFIVANAPQEYGIQILGTSGSHVLGNRLDYVEVAYSYTVGIDCSYADNWVISNCIQHDGKMYGIAIGGGGDLDCNNGTYIDCESYNTGDMGGQSQGFQYVGVTNITYLRCKSHNNGRDGFDGGVIYDGSASSATYINCSSYDNGEDGFGTNGGYNQDVIDLNKATYINCISFNNGGTGWDIYSGATAYVYNSIAHNNGNTLYWAGNFLIYSDCDSVTRATIKNCIIYKPKTHASVYVYTAPNPDLPTYIYSDYNIFVPRSSNSEVFYEEWGITYDYDTLPSWVGPHDRVGMAYDDVNFTSIDTSSFAANDYHLLSGSCAINAGVYLNSPSDVQTDRDGVSRSNPPEIGMYEYGEGLISGLAVNDSANAADWSIRSNLQAGDASYGDRVYTLESVPASVAGAAWIRPACDSKAYTSDPLCSFNISQSADVYVASDDRIATKPSWMSTWTDTGEDIVDDASPQVTYSLYKKTYSAGTVSLGNSGDTTHVQYLIIVKPAAVPGTELFANPGFESGTASWGVYGSGAIAQETSIIHGGTKSCKHTGRTAIWNSPSQDIRAALINNGQGSYSMSGWIRLASGSDTAGLTIATQDGTGTHYFGLTHVAVNSSSWAQASGTLNITWSGTLTTAFVYVETGSSTANLYVDDCSLKKN